ncbi:methyl-accepting chemotaxis protein [Vibrio anguillarum]|uniref:methyl-accepting chemotaxis protein n=1 Tax=Vibrio anguillarum TaxID=55601 RepID=UPI0018FEB707|nr:methyl-accepting chemotaxis protein [Vibrio anguillarum]MBF4424968.1 methyl-accepting chemotaxis protein [Vibrio anguillarum]
MNLSLKGKLIMTSLLVVIVMAVVLTLLSANLLKDETESGIKERVYGISKSATSSITQWLDVRSKVISAVIPHTMKEDSLPFLQQAQQGAQFDLLYFGTEQGTMHRSIPSRGADNASYDPRTRGWYQEAKNSSGTILTAAYADAITGALMVTLAEPIKKNGQFWGVIGADVLIDQLVKDVIAIDAGAKSNAMLINRDTGLIVAHRNKDLILKPLASYSPNLTQQVIDRSMAENKIQTVMVGDVEKLLFFTAVPETDWVLGIELDKEVEYTNIGALFMQLTSISVAITILVVIVFSALVGFLLRDLGRVSQALAEIADGDADLTQRIEPRYQDEVGALANNFNQFVGNMHGMIKRFHEVSQGLTLQAENTAAQAHERTRRIMVQQDEINMVATAINEMAAATQEIAGNADNTAATSLDTVKISNHGVEQVKNTQQSISELSKEMTVAKEVIENLNQHAQNINTILSAIQGIAEQTNLLALNAAIEAARAGEQGRGFAVVADEVRVLSQRTHSSTQEIQQTIETLQKTTTQAVNIMTESSKLSESSVEDANVAAQSLVKIGEAVGTISDMATQIATAAEEQASVTEEITRNTQGIRDVSDELAKEAQEASQQAELLSSLSKELQQEINRFKL